MGENPSRSKTHKLQPEGLAFGVVVCPRCGRAKGVKMTKKTTTCSCGFEIRVVPAKVRVRVSTERDLIEAVRRVNAELGGGLAAYEKAMKPRTRRRTVDVHARVAAASRVAGDKAHRIRAAAVELSKELEVFSYDDLRQVLLALGIHDIDESLDELLRSNVVYEPREGFYRTVTPTL
ncbi:MAG TPA: DUF1922 domain-containing protein [Thermoplasmata archaeon]|nr:DUF1922 domain-containing protein [Thermoplasmata archaeon]